jgi:hypothetical protein
VKWMVTREQSRGQPLAAPLPPAPIVPPPAAAAAPAPGAASLRMFFSGGGAVPITRQFDIRDAIGYCALPPAVKIERVPIEQCTATTYADALHRLPPADLVNVRSAGCSAHRNPLYRPLPAQFSCACVQYYWNTLTGDVCPAEPDNAAEPDFSPFGGLLCDHMGLGKASLVFFLHFFSSDFHPCRRLCNASPSYHAIPTLLKSPAALGPSRISTLTSCKHPLPASKRRRPQPCTRSIHLECLPTNGLFLQIRRLTSRAPRLSFCPRLYCTNGRKS